MYARTSVEKTAVSACGMRRSDGGVPSHGAISRCIVVFLIKRALPVRSIPTKTEDYREKHDSSTSTSHLP